MNRPTPPVLADRYELRRLIGRGGMAQVHLAFDRVLHREVAVKIMRSDHGPDGVDRARFHAEVQLLAGLDHPHLVTLYDAGVDHDADEGDRPWLVMELVTGPTLAQRVAAGPLAPDEAAALGAGLASALAHVHRHGVVHRDVKPANVLTTATGEAKLADFGVARSVGDPAGLTATGTTVGTAAYLAPEQLRGDPVDGAADVYALGLVLLEAMTGQRCFTGTATEAALARLSRAPVVPTSLGPAWMRLLEQMSASDPADRPDAAAAAVRLAELADPAPSQPHATRVMPSVLPVAAADQETPAGRRAAVVAIGAVAALFVVALVVAVLTRGSGGDPPTAGDHPAPSSSPSARPHARATTGTPAVTTQTPPASRQQPVTHPVVKHPKKPKPPKSHGHVRPRGPHHKLPPGRARKHGRP